MAWCQLSYQPVLVHGPRVGEQQCIQHTMVNTVGETQVHSTDFSFLQPPKSRGLSKEPVSAVQVKSLDSLRCILTVNTCMSLV